jgi:hypothetical protein
LDAVINQDFQDFGFIFIDDGSDKGPENQLLNYAIDHEDKITYLRHSNCSQAKNSKRFSEQLKEKYRFSNTAVVDILFVTIRLLFLSYKPERGTLLSIRILYIVGVEGIIETI